MTKKTKTKIHPLIFWGALILLLAQIGFFKTLTVVTTSASANSVCTISGNTASCSIGNYVGIGCAPDTSTWICIDGVSADGMSAFFSANNFYPTECDYSCSYSGYGGISGSTGTITGSGTSGCYGSFKRNVGYFGGNAFQVNCGVSFRQGTTTTQPPPQPPVSVIVEWINQLFASIWSWIKGLFGWSIW